MNGRAWGASEEQSAPEPLKQVFDDGRAAREQGAGVRHGHAGREVADRGRVDLALQPETGFANPETQKLDFNTLGETCS